MSELKKGYDFIALEIRGKNETNYTEVVFNDDYETVTVKRRVVKHLVLGEDDFGKLVIKVYSSPKEVYLEEARIFRFKNFDDFMSILTALKDMTKDTDVFTTYQDLNEISDALARNATVASFEDLRGNHTVELLYERGFETYKDEIVVVLTFHEPNEVVFESRFVIKRGILISNEYRTLKNFALNEVKSPNDFVKLIYMLFENNLFRFSKDL